MGILDYFTLMESHETNNLLSKFSGKEFQIWGNFPSRNHAWNNHCPLFNLFDAIGDVTGTCDSVIATTSKVQLGIVGIETFDL